jgi:hypothetical protein
LTEEKLEQWNKEREVSLALHSATMVQLLSPVPLQVESWRCSLSQHHHHHDSNNNNNNNNNNQIKQHQKEVIEKWLFEMSLSSNSNMVVDEMCNNEWISLQSTSGGGGGGNGGGGGGGGGGSGGGGDKRVTMRSSSLNNEEDHQNGFSANFVLDLPPLPLGAQVRLSLLQS